MADHGNGPTDGRRSWPLTPRPGLTTPRMPRSGPGLDRSGVAGRRRADEAAIQRAVVDALRVAAAPGIAWTHMPAGEVRDRATAGKLKGLGVQPGWPDLLIVKGGRLYGLELKTETGRPSPAQVAAHATLRLAGAEIAVAHGIDAALAQLRAWGVLRMGVGQNGSSPGAAGSEAREGV